MRIEPHLDFAIEIIGRRPVAGSHVVDTDKANLPLHLDQPAEWRIGVYFKSAASKRSGTQNTRGGMKRQTIDDDGWRQSVVVRDPIPRRTVVPGMTSKHARVRSRED